jgi:integrase
MHHLSPSTLTHVEQNTTLRATNRHTRDHLIYSLALGTGLRLAEIVGLNVGDVYIPDGKPKNRVRLRSEIAKNGRAGDVFLPDVLLAKFRRFWRYMSIEATFDLRRERQVSSVFQADANSSRPVLRKSERVGSV